MKTYQYAIFPALIITVFGFSAIPTSDREDPVAAGFERELNHEPVVPAPAAPVDGVLVAGAEQ